MNCKEFENNMIAFVEDALPSIKSTEMQEHIDNCVACKKLFQEVKSTFSLLDDNSIPDMKPFFMTRLEQRLENENVEYTIGTKLRWLYSAAAVVVMLLGVALGITIGKNITPVQLSDNSQQYEMIQDTDAEDFGLISFNDYTIESYILEDE